MGTGRQLRSRRGVPIGEVHVGGVDPQRAAVWHRVAGVDGEVDQDLLHLPRVDQDRIEPLRERALQLHVLAEGAQQQLFDLTHHVVDVDDLGLDDLASREGEQLVGQVRRSLAGEADLLDVIARAAPALPTTICGCRCEILRDEGGIVDDHREQVVEVMGNASGKLPEALQALSLVELVLQSLAFGLRLQSLTLTTSCNALADVPVDLQDPHEPAHLVLLCCPAALHHQTPAVLGVLDQILPSSPSR